MHGVILTSKKAISISDIQKREASLGIQIPVLPNKIVWFDLTYIIKSLNKILLYLTKINEIKILYTFNQLTT